MTPIESGILQNLSVFHFLTREQIIRLGIAKDPKHLGDILRRLDRHKLISTLSWGVYPGLGRLPQMYHLTRKGADTLAAFLRHEHVRPPYIRGHPKFQLDHLHRRACVDMHIALVQWAAQHSLDIERLITYYAPKPNTTRIDLKGIGSFFPDALLVLRKQDKSPALFAIEICMDRNGTDRARIARQLENHRKAIELGALGDTLGVPRGNRVLAIFDNKAGMDSIRKTLVNDPLYAPCRTLFLFGLLDTIRENFGGNWDSLSEQQVNLA